MAQQKMLLGHVKGDKGDTGSPGKDGIDAKVVSATGTVTPGHLDEPTVSIEFGGEPGAQTANFTFAGLQGERGEAGTPGTPGQTGPAGRDADISEVTVTVNPGHSDSPSATAQVSGEAGAKTIELTFDGLQGATGAAGPAGPAGPAYQPGGTSSEVVLGDGTTKSIELLLQENVETIRAAIGVATKERDGLIPKLPENPNA